MRATRCTAKSPALQEPSFFDNHLTLDELLTETRGMFAKKSIYKWVSQENMPHVKIRGKLLFPKPEVFHWLQRSST